MSHKSVVFVIGGSGYLGVELTKKLKLDFDRVVSTYNSNPFSDGIKFNLLDYDEHKILIDIANDYAEINVLFLATSKKKITIFSTPFDLESLKILEKLNCPAYKISSMDLVNYPLIEAVGRLQKPIII